MLPGVFASYELGGGGPSHCAGSPRRRENRAVTPVFLASLKLRTQAQQSHGALLTSYSFYLHHLFWKQEAGLSSGA